MSTIDPKSKFKIVARFNRDANVTEDFEQAVTEGREPIELSENAREVLRNLAQNPISPALMIGLIRMIDFTAIVALGLVIYVWHVVPVDGLTWQYFVPLIGGVSLTIVTFQAADAYQVAALKSFFKQCARVLGAWTIMFAIFAVVAFLAKIGAEFSRVWFAAWYLMGTIYILISRIVFSYIIQRWIDRGRLGRRTVIVGGGENAKNLIKALENQSDSDIQICGIFDDRSDDRSPPDIAGYPKLGTVKELVEFARLGHIELLIVTLPIEAESRILQTLAKLWVLPVDIRLSTHADTLSFRARSCSYVGPVPVLNLFDKPLADWDAILKRAFDLVIASLAIVLLAPLMIATAIAIRLESPGPFFFRQKRFGFNNEIISVLKFRSMRHDQADPDAKQLVTRNDSRVTKVGRFIRKTSIDELPQLFNVLAGDLSLVGPRPHAVNAQTMDHLWDTVIDGYFARHKVKPGVTGWAQINGWRGEVDTPEKIKRRVDHDLYYIENWSVLFDLYILALTPFSLLNTENAY